MIAAAKSASPSARSCAGGAREAARRSRASSSGTPMTPVEATATWSSRHAGGHRGGALHLRARRRGRGRRWRRSRCRSSRRRRGARRGARARCVTSDRRREHARAREARGARRVAARRRRAGRRRGRPDGLMPAATPAARKPAGSPPRPSRVTCSGHLDPARAEERGRGALTARCPRSRRSPNIRLRFCTACDEDALPEVVDRGEDEDLAGALVEARVRSGRCSCRARRGRRAAVDELDERLVGVGAREELRRPGGRAGR